MMLIKIKLNYQLKLLIKKRAKPKSPEKKKDTVKSVHALFEGKEKVLSGFKIGIFPITPIKGTGMSAATTEILKY